MTKHLLSPPPTPPTPAAEALDRALDALVLGDSGAMERLSRLDPDLHSTVEEVFSLADLGGFAKERTAWSDEIASGPRRPMERRRRRSQDPTRSHYQQSRSIVPNAQARRARAAPDPTSARSIPRVNARWTRAMPLIAATALLVAAVGVSMFIADQDNRRDPQPVMIAASDADPTAESTRELIELPPSTRPLTVSTGETLGFGGMAAGDVSVFRLLATPEFTGVEAVDAETETVAWRLATSWSSAGIYAGASGVYVATDPRRLTAIDPATGADLWQISFGAPVVSMALQDADLRDDVLYVWDESSTMTAIDTATGDPLWQTTTSDPGGPQGPTARQTTPGIAPAIGADVVVMVAANGTLNAFDRSTGEIAWSTAGFDGVNTRLVINFDYLMVLSASPDATDGPENLIGTGVDLRTGDVKWQLGVSGPLLQPAASNETFFYLIANQIVTLPEGREAQPRYVNYGRCCNDWTGAERLVASSGEIPKEGAHVFGVDTSSGEVIWSRGAKAGGFISLATVFPQSGGLLAVTSDGQRVSPGRESGDIYPGPTDLGGPVIELIPFSVDMVRYVTMMADGSLATIRRTQPPG